MSFKSELKQLFEEVSQGAPDEVAQLDLMSKVMTFTSRVQDESRVMPLDVFEGLNAEQIRILLTCFGIGLIQYIGMKR